MEEKYAQKCDMTAYKNTCFSTDFGLTTHQMVTAGSFLLTVYGQWSR